MLCGYIRPDCALQFNDVGSEPDADGGETAGLRCLASGVTAYGPHRRGCCIHEQYGQCVLFSKWENMDVSGISAKGSGIGGL